MKKTNIVIGLFTLFLISACGGEEKREPFTGSIASNGQIGFFLDGVLLKEIDFEEKTVKYPRKNKLMEQVLSASFLEKMYHLKIPNIIYRDHIETLYGLPKEKICAYQTFKYEYGPKGHLIKIRYLSASGFYKLEYDDSGRIIKASTVDESSKYALANFQTYRYEDDGKLDSAGKQMTTADSYESQLISVSPFVVVTKAKSLYLPSIADGTNLGRVYYDENMISWYKDRMKITANDMKNYKKKPKTQKIEELELKDSILWNSLVVRGDNNKIDVERTKNAPLTFPALGLWETVTSIAVQIGINNSVMHKLEMVWNLQTEYLKNRVLVFDDKGRVKQEQFPDYPERQCRVVY